MKKDPLEAKFYLQPSAGKTAIIRIKFEYLPELENLRVILLPEKEKKINQLRLKFKRKKKFKFYCGKMQLGKEKD